MGYGSIKLCLWHENVREAWNNDIQNTVNKRREAVKMIRAAGTKQKSIATQRAFKSSDHNPQFRDRRVFAFASL